MGVVGTVLLLIGAYLVYWSIKNRKFLKEWFSREHIEEMGEETIKMFKKDEKK